MSDTTNPNNPNDPHDPSDLTKATKQQIDATMEVIKAMSEVMARTKEAAEAIEVTTGKWTTDLKEATSFVNEAFRTITATAESFSKMRQYGEATNQLRRQAATIEKEIKEEMEYYKEDIKVVQSIWSDIDDMLDKINAKMSKSGGGRATLKATASIDQASHALMDVESLPKKIMSLIPGGGLIELMFMGVSKHADWQAKSEMVVQQFDSMGGGAREFKAAIAENIETMEQWNDHATQDLVGVANALKSGGITAKEALGKDGLHGDLKGLGTSLSDLTLKFDYMMEVGAGTGAKLVASGYKDFGNTIHDSAEFVTKYGLAAQNAGQETMAFLGSIMQNAEGLKLWHVQLSTVGDQQLRLIELNKRRGLSAAYAGAIGAAGQAQAFSGLQSMNEGYAAFIGERVVKSLGVGARERLDREGSFGSSPVGIMMEMKRGFRDLGDDPASKSALSTMIHEITKQAREAAGPDRANQEFYLMTMGFGVEGSRAIMDMSKDIAVGKGVSHAQLETLKNATKSQEQQMSAMVVAMNRVAQGVADIATGLLGVILASIKLIIGLLYALYEKATAPYKSISEGTTKFIESAFAGIGKSTGMIGQGVKIGKGISDAAKTVLGDFDTGFGNLGERSPDEEKKNGGPFGYGDIYNPNMDRLNQRLRELVGERALTPTEALKIMAAAYSNYPSTSQTPQSEPPFIATATAPAPDVSSMTMRRTENGYYVSMVSPVRNEFFIPINEARGSNQASSRGQ